MSQKPLADKLLIKEGYKVLLVNPPADYQPKLGNLVKATITTNQSEKPFDLIQLFISTQEQMEENLPKTKSLLKVKGILWVTYPKGKAEINRDSIREYADTIALQAVSLVAVDDVWSALRLKVV